MAPRSQLEIVTSSVTRLVKEEASYHRELEQQIERIKKLESSQEGDDENKEFLAKQENMAMEETKKVLPSLRQKIVDSVKELEALIAEESQKGTESNAAHITAAQEAISKAKAAQR
ncbi:uncharacterized protein N7484_001563 [Penicillium longicatenatum]|uniref:uncharacterized protein n=1 Tax=Penicillium longicatenatum TaxID=1561947 RepID=UPI0025483915|nr:uncharacterized protein N7484_001563 [Penicillium longicatenatum]KAJ5657914.1 hypothetical protein N7484_001563 [Penicillium longicatenatum]KAJ5663594.1 hypothetical protein N7507_004325 [Penicillium longicatenatum]